MNLPTATDAERSLLGALLMDFRIANDALRAYGVTDEAFTNPSHVKILATARKIDDSNRPVTLVSVAEHLRNAGELDAVGGMNALMGMVEVSAVPAACHHDAELVRKRWVQRAMIQAATEVIVESQTTESPEDVAAKAEAFFSRLGIRRDTETIPKVYDQMSRDMVAAMNGEKVDIALPTGFEQVDRILTGGLRPGGVYYITGQKGCGKTTWKCCVINQQLFRGKRVSDASLEMTMRQEIEKLAGAQMNCNIANVILGKEAIPEDRIRSVRDVLAKGQLRIETRIESPAQLRAWARREVEQFKADLLCVDYIQLIRSPDMKGDKVFEQVTEASRSITRIAKEFNIPVLCVSMMSKDGLWGSRQLDYDAYATLEMRTESEPSPPDYVKDVDCWFNKNRFGPEHFSMPFKLYGRVGQMVEAGATQTQGGE